MEVMDEWQVVFTKFMDLRMRSKDGKTSVWSAFTHYYILLLCTVQIIDVY